MTQKDEKALFKYHCVVLILDIRLPFTQIYLCLAMRPSHKITHRRGFSILVSWMCRRFYSERWRGVVVDRLFGGEGRFCLTTGNSSGK